MYDSLAVWALFTSWLGLVYVIVVWIIFAMAAGYLAKRLNRDAFGYVCLGFLVGFPALVLLWAMGEREPTEFETSQKSYTDGVIARSGDTYEESVKQKKQESKAQKASRLAREAMTNGN